MCAGGDLGVSEGGDPGVSEGGDPGVYAGGGPGVHADGELGVQWGPRSIYRWDSGFHKLLQGILMLTSRRNQASSLVGGPGSLRGHCPHRLTTPPSVHIPSVKEFEAEAKCVLTKQVKCMSLTQILANVLTRWFMKSCFNIKKLFEKENHTTGKHRG